jgi:uncharacterized iron-regulated protein
MKTGLTKLLFWLIGLALMTGCSSGRARWVVAADQTAFAGMIAEVKQSRVIFVGEFHDRRAHHTMQLEIIKGIRQTGQHLAIGLEMFDLASQPLLDQWVRGDMDLARFIASYQQNWSVSWAEYDALLLYARNNRIPLVALNAPADLVQKVARHGFSILTPQDLSRLPSGVSGSVSPSYRDFLQDAFADHHLDERLFKNFCEAQALRNSAMGSLITSWLTQNQGSRMVIITGVGHAMRRAVADDLISRQGLSTRIIVPVTDGLFDRIDRDDADYFVYP